MTQDHLTQFILLPELKFHQTIYSGYGKLGLLCEKVSDFEVCPHCAQKTSSIYDRRTIKSKDHPIRGSQTNLHIIKRRFRCQNKTCRKVFTEPIGGISKGSRVTQRFKRGVTWACRNFSTLKAVVKAFHCSSRLVYEAFYEQLALYAKAHEHPLPISIGLDEHSIRKPKYKAVDFATIVVDHKGRKVLDLIDGKDIETLRAAFSDKKGKENVRKVTIDMSLVFRSFIKETFPNAMIVADRFHVQRLFSRKVNKYRKKVTGDDRKNPVRKLLLRNSKSLQLHERSAVGKFLQAHLALWEIYEAKEAMYRFFEIRGYKRARARLNHLLDRWGRSSLPALRQSNGRVEGFNRKGKLIQRRCYGITNFSNYRLRLLNECY